MPYATAPTRRLFVGDTGDATVLRAPAYVPDRALDWYDIGEFE